MLRVRAVTPHEGRSVRLTLSNGTDVEPDLTDLPDRPVFERIAPETLIWDGPTPADEATRRPERFLRPRSPNGSAR